MQIIESILITIVSLIIYYLFGTLVCVGRKKRCASAVTLVVGFFSYYALFSIVCLPIMLTYRPLSLLTKSWLAFVVLVVAIAIIVNRQYIADNVKGCVECINAHRSFFAVVFVLLVVQLVLVIATYNFTLDAAYYVANVSTSVDTNMINVYDPFTGAWQDHFELRYAFATYSIHDAVVCQLTKIPALVQTKTVMSAVVMILVNALYIYIARFFGKEDYKQSLVMYIGMVFINLTFITIYTPANFLMTRTYEGKSIVGNIAVIAIFVMYMMAVRYGMDNSRYWLMMFAICFGTATVSSTANMLIPAQVCILYIPYIIKHRAYRVIPKVLICILPEVIMMMMYVLYVKGYFAIYTYPR